MIISANQNLLKPFLRLILPREIHQATGPLVALASDALFCGTDKIDSNSASAIVQIVKASQPYAPHLTADDCQPSLDHLLAKHKDQADFSGALKVQLNWNAWTLTVRTQEAVINPSANFSTDDLAAINNYSAAISTMNIPLDSATIHERYGLSVKFIGNEIILGFFTATGRLAADWWKPDNQARAQTTSRTNAHVYFRTSLISDYLHKYPDAVNYAIPGSNFSLDHFSVEKKQDSSLLTRADAKVAEGVTLHFIVNWAGTPLLYRSIDVNPDPATGLTKATALQVRTAAAARLQNKLFLPKTTRGIEVTIGQQRATFSFISDNSALGESYLQLSGNGGLDLAR